MSDCWSSSSLTLITKDIPGPILKCANQRTVSGLEDGLSLVSACAYHGQSVFKLALLFSGTLGSPLFTVSVVVNRG